MKYKKTNRLFKQRLQFFDHFITFRRQIRSVPAVLIDEKEEIIDALVAEILNTNLPPCLFILTTHQLLCFEPLWSTKVHIWNGQKQLDAWIRFDPNNRTITFNILNNQKQSNSDLPIQYRKHNELNARRFHAMALALSESWGKPEKFESLVNLVYDEINKNL